MTTGNKTARSKNETAKKRKHGGGYPAKLDPVITASVLMRNGGNYREAARRFGVTRQSIQDFVTRTPGLKQLIADVRGGDVDDAVTSLQRGVKGGEQWATLFTLRTLGKDRGYVEPAKSETNINMGGNVPSVSELALLPMVEGMTAEEIRAYREMLGNVIARRKAAALVSHKDVNRGAEA